MANASSELLNTKKELGVSKRDILRKNSGKQRKNDETKMCEEN